MIPINHQNNTILSKCNRISDPSKIGIMLIIEITKLELTGGHIRNMLIEETSKSELTNAILDSTKYRECLNRIKWRPY